MRGLLIAVFLFFSMVIAEPPHRGSYEVGFIEYDVSTLQRPFAEVVVAYPISNGNETFPFVSFAHGLGGGGLETKLGHMGIFRGMASHGLIVAATKSCNFGCAIGGWDTYYEEQLKVIDWSQSPAMRNDPIIGRVNHQLGYGIAGHSMGGQATARCSIRASNYNIRAAVLLHPFADSNEHIGDQIQVPLLGLTGTEDGCCGEEATRHYYDDANVPKSLANMIGIQHTEPNVPNSIWEAYLAAWFKIYMEGDRGEYYSLIYNRANPDGLCQYYPSVTCVHQNV